MPVNAILKASAAPKGDWLSAEELATLTPAVLKARVEALVPMIASHAEEAERIRRPVDEVWNALRKAGVFYQMVPKIYGGLEFGPEDFLDVMLPLGEACASTCWVATFCVEHNWLFAMFDKAAQDDIFGRFPYIIAPGVTSPPGKAVRVPGGFRLSGKWRWGTGVMHSDWIMANGLVDSDNGPVPHYFMVPIEESIIHDTWYVDGMIGTGSNDIEVRDVFVPAERAMDMNLMRVGMAPGTIFHRDNGSKAFRMPMTAFMGLTAAIAALGTARNAVNWWRDRMKAKPVFGAQTMTSEKPAAQMRLARAENEVRMVELILRDAARRIDFLSMREEPVTVPERLELRIQIANAVDMARNAVRIMADAAGTTAHYTSSPMQRALRDLNVIATHIVFDMDTVTEQRGRVLVGLEPTTTLL